MPDMDKISRGEAIALIRGLAGSGGGGSGITDVQVNGTSVVTDGVADITTGEIKQGVEDWLDEHIDPTTGYVVDDTLSIAGAAADAKAVGDELADVKSAVGPLEESVFGTVKTDCGLTNGTIVNPSNTDAVRTSNYIECEIGDVVTLYPVRPVTDGYEYRYTYTIFNASKVSIAEQSGAAASNNPVAITQSAAKYIQFAIFERNGSSTLPLRADTYGYVPYVSVSIAPSMDTRISNLSAEDQHIYSVMEQATQGTKPASYRFIRGGLRNAAVDTSYTYRIVNEDIVYPNSTVTFNVKSGYQFYLAEYDAQGVATGISYDFRTTPLTRTFITTGYRIIIAKTPEDTSTPADIEAFSRGVYIEFGLKTSDIIAFDSTDYLLSPGYIDADGSIHAQAGGTEVVSDFIPVMPGDKYLMTIECASNQWGGYAFYDLGKTVIDSRVTFEGYKKLLPVNRRLSTKEITVPSGAAYIRICARTHNYADYIRFVKVEDKNGVKVDGNRIYDDLLKLKYADYDERTAIIKSVNHRGYRENGAGENTIPAYQESFDNGFYYVECDVRYTADDVPVLLHDDSINRTAYDANGDALPTTPKIYIADLTLAEAQAYKFGTGAYECTISTFDDFIKFCKFRGLHPYIELKVAPIAPLFAIVQKYGMERNVTWIGYDAPFLADVAALDPDARLGWLTTATENNISSFLACKTQNQKLFLDTYYTDINDSYCEFCAENGLPLEMYTVNDGTSAATYAAKGVTGFTTDKTHVQWELKYASFS